MTKRRCADAHLKPGPVEALVADDGQEVDEVGQIGTAELHGTAPAGKYVCSSLYTSISGIR
ncbi:hypothetical protein D3C81_1745900 [compost metagenome]